MHALKIFQRFHFSSALKRMSVIAGHTKAGSTDTDYIATVKGAPETLRNMVTRDVVNRNINMPNWLHTAVSITHSHTHTRCRCLSCLHLLC